MRFCVSRQKVWLAIAPRVGEVVDFAALAEEAGTTLLAQRSWLLSLERSGYLLRQGRGYDRHRLERHTGIMAPMRRRDGSLYDPNLAGPIELGGQRLWVALRIQKSLAQDEGAQFSGLSLGRVCQLLAAWRRVGVVARSARKPYSYWIVRNQAIAPIVLSQGVFDVYLNRFLEEK